MTTLSQNPRSNRYIWSSEERSHEIIGIKMITLWQNQGKILIIET